MLEKSILFERDFFFLLYQRGLEIVKWQTCFPFEEEALPQIPG